MAVDSNGHTLCINFKGAGGPMFKTYQFAPSSNEFEESYALDFKYRLTIPTHTHTIENCGRRR